MRALVWIIGVCALLVALVVIGIATSWFGLYYTNHVTTPIQRAAAACSLQNVTQTNADLRTDLAHWNANSVKIKATNAQLAAFNRAHPDASKWSVGDQQTFQQLNDNLSALTGDDANTVQDYNNLIGNADSQCPALQSSQNLPKQMDPNKPMDSTYTIPVQKPLPGTN